MWWLRLIVGACLVGLGVGLTGCPTDDGACANVGESCEIFCCANLSCHATDHGGYCTKGCQCAVGTPVCAPPTFDVGCPQGSVCLAEESDGSGECVTLCDTSPCLAGQVACTDPGDGGIQCQRVPEPPDLAGTGDGN